VGVKFKDSKEVESFFELYWMLFNNTRMAFHRGHTPNEIYMENGSQFDPGDRMVPLRCYTEFENMHNRFPISNLPAQTKITVRTDGQGRAEPVKAEGSKIDPLAENVYRNALCPCGSGKKYKRCCGQKPGNFS
jgi:hypothetical protein